VRYNKTQKEDELIEQDSVDLDTVEKTHDIEQVLLDKCLQKFDLQQR
jgi:hypothetical protein